LESQPMRTQAGGGSNEVAGTHRLALQVLSVSRINRFAMEIASEADASRSAITGFFVRISLTRRSGKL